MKKFIIGMVLAIIMIPLMGFGYLYFKLNSMYDKQEANEISTMIENADKNKQQGITNILLVGVDGNNIEKGMVFPN